MRATRRNASRPKRACNGPDSQAGSCALLELPVEVLHQVLSALGPGELIRLLQTSKAIAQQVMQHSAGQLTLKLKLPNRSKDAAARQLQQAVNLAACRQLLHWAPPSTLKLRLDGCCNFSDWDLLSSLFCFPSTSLSSQPSQQLQQYPCISNALIENSTLPSLLPAGLATTCPSLHALHLSNCIIHGSSSSSGGSGSGYSSNSSTASNITSSALHTLILEESHVHLEQIPAGNVRVTRSKQAAVQHAAQLKHSLPGVTCLKLLDCPQNVELLSVFGPQLKELQIGNYYRTPVWGSLAAVPHLQQLQKLVLPTDTISSASVVDQLLSLTSLTHLEVDSVSRGLSKNYSSHPCKWQRLHLRLAGGCLFLSALAKLPLHSLQHPLKLGCEDQELSLIVPPRHCVGSLANLEHLGQQLMRCGVQTGCSHIAWAVDCDVTPQLGAEMAPSLALIAPAMGPQTRVVLEEMTVDQPVFQTLVAVYGSSLQQLDLLHCNAVEDMQAAWHAALSGLPSLARLTLGTPRTTLIIRALAAAMVQQPAGRCIEVLTFIPFCTSEGLAALVKHGAQQELEHVQVLAQDRVGSLCLHIIRKHVP